MDRSERNRTEGTSETAHNKIIHGSQLIGLQLWDSENQQIGVVKDFFIENTENDCPAIFLATSPVGFGSDTYVIVPYSTLQVQYDTNRRSNYFVINMRVNDLRDAPRIRGNDWDVIKRGDFLTNTRTFYRKVERTAARPDRGTYDGRNLRDGDRDQNRREDNRDQNLRNDNRDQRREDSTREPRPPSQDSRTRKDSGDRGGSSSTSSSSTNVPPPQADRNNDRNTENPPPAREKSDSKDAAPPTDKSPPKTPPPPAEKNSKSGQ